MARGFYSVVQYCPDVFRAEAVNVGLVLLCVDPHGVPASELLKRIAAERAERERLAKEAKAAAKEIAKSGSRRRPAP